MVGNDIEGLNGGPAEDLPVGERTKYGGPTSAPPKHSKNTNYYYYYYCPDNIAAKRLQFQMLSGKQKKTHTRPRRILAMKLNITYISCARN